MDVVLIVSCLIMHAFLFIVTLKQFAMDRLI